MVVKIIASRKNRDRNTKKVVVGGSFSSTVYTSTTCLLCICMYANLILEKERSFFGYDRVRTAHTWKTA